MRTEVQGLPAMILGTIRVLALLQDRHVHAFALGDRVSHLSGELKHQKRNFPGVLAFLVSFRYERRSKRFFFSFQQIHF
jgi:hypothetical protein